MSKKVHLKRSKKKLSHYVEMKDIQLVEIERKNIQLMDQLLKLPQNIYKHHNIVESLENKIIAYVKISTEFNFFSNLENLIDSGIKNAADGPQKDYPESYLYEELVKFNYLLNKKRSGING